MPGKLPLLLPALLLIARLAAADAPPPPDGKVLLLRNGQVIEGHIERNGDYYTVTAPDQEIAIHSGAVEAVCRDLHDGYEKKKAAIQPRDFQQHLELLLWCERQGLMDCARQELDAATAIDAEHPMIAVLRRRLAVESQPPPATVAKQEKVDPPPSDEQLDHMTRGMPAGTVELFVQVVEPILLNHYPGARGYALPDNRRLYLMRPALGETPSRRVTQRNLYAVLQCIDWNNPGESSMLKASTGPVASTSAFPGRFSMQYQRLAQWVYLVAQKPMPTQDGLGVENASFTELAGGETPTALSHAKPRIPYTPSSLGRGRAKEDGADASSVPPAASKAKPKDSAHSSESRRPMREAAQQATAKAIESVDPYDPAAFNDQSGAATQMPTPAARVLRGER